MSFYADIESRDATPLVASVNTNPDSSCLDQHKCNIIYPGRRSNELGDVPDEPFGDFFGA